MNARMDEGGAGERQGQADVFRVLGVPISVVDMPSALARIDAAIKGNQGGYICIRDTHGVMVAQNDKYFRDLHEDALMVTPDGMPLVWLGRLDKKLVRRVCGPDLLGALCARSVGMGYEHYFFGGLPGVAEKLAATVSKVYPGIQIAGYESPEFRAIAIEPDEDACRRIMGAKPKIVWIGLGSPKQEYWMKANAPLLPGTILIGVGAAFDFHAGNLKRAPTWMQRSGLEWLFRLSQEPGRLWRRYLVLAPHFVFLVLAERIGSRLRRDRQMDSKL